MLPAKGCLLLLLFFCYHDAHAQEQQQQQQPEKKKKKILSLGGNGMIGAATLRRLIETGEYDITLASRGSWPFDTSTLIRPFVHWVECDRDVDDDDDDEDIEKACPDLVADIQATSHYHAVIDFSAYQPHWVQDVLDLLWLQSPGSDNNKVRVYIYVSTDSVYEVSESPTQPLVISLDDGGTTIIRKTLETEAVRPNDPEVRKELHAFDEYGDEKFAGEEVLIEQRKQEEGKGIPYVFLRFADVLGPRDQSDRFIVYLVWILYHDVVQDTMPLYVPASILEMSSVTYVEDAAWSIVATMEEPATWDEAYNIASDEIFNVTAAVETMVKLLHRQDDIQIKRTSAHDKDDDENDAFAMYPSITRGPIDVSKAMNKLGFVPTSIHTMLQTTIDWYQELWSNDKRELTAAIAEWADTLFEDRDEDERLDILQKVLAVAVAERKISDEL